MALKNIIQKINQKSKKLAQKKAQFYIFTAILLSSMMLAIVTTSSKITRPESAFRELEDNFMDESAVVVNSAIYNGTNVSLRYLDFVNKFLDYSRGKESTFSLAYVLAYDNTVEINNRLSEDVFVRADGQSFRLGANERTAVSRTKNIVLTYNKNDYELDLNSYSADVHALFVSRKEQAVRIDVR